MKIQWKEDVELEICNCSEECDYDDEDCEDEDDCFETSCETAKAGEIEEVDILNDEDEGGDSVDMQFGNGSVAYGVPRDSFDIIEED